MCYVRNEKRQSCKSEGVKLPNGETIKSLEDKKGYKYLGFLQFASVKSKEMKDTITKEYYRRIRKILKASINAAINARAESIIRYGAGIVVLEYC